MRFEGDTGRRNFEIFNETRGISKQGRSRAHSVLCISVPCRTAFVIVPVAVEAQDIAQLGAPEMPEKSLTTVIIPANISK
ncbi:hypothetical protein ABBQ38_005746 [Trebouxia sp. C0009 RCD-2024]